MIYDHNGEVSVYQHVIQVSDKHFSEASAEDMLRKAMAEIQECLDAPTSKKLGELVDAQICLWGALDKLNYKLYDLLVGCEFKSIVNDKREWDRLPDGTYQHKEGK